jgi:hypothetical protein
MLLDLYGERAVAETPYRAGEDPVAAAPWFDANNYVVERHPRYQNLWIQGGPRMRAFFADDPAAAPALNKTPLVRWRRGQAFRTSTHTLLPRHLNRTYARQGGAVTSGVLLHTKFLDTAIDKAREEKTRRQHFENSALYQTYYDGLIANPDLWCERSSRYTSWRQLEAMGLMSKGTWL